MSKDVSIQDITNKFIELEREIQDLRHSKAQAESFCAAIVKKYGTISVSFNDIFKANYSHVGVKPDEGDSSTLVVAYFDEPVDK